MSISTPVVLTSGGSGTDGTVYTSASISPGANKLLLLFVSNASLTNADDAVIGGTLGLTWTKIVDQPNTVSSPDTLRGGIYRAVTGGTPPTGNVSMTFNNTQSNAQWHIWEITGADLSNPVVQSGSQPFQATTNPSFNLPSAPLSTSLVCGMGCRNNTTAWTAGANYTLLSSVAGSASPTMGSDCEYDLGSPIQAVRFTTTQTAQKMLLGVEIREAPTNLSPTADAGPDQIDKEPGDTIQLNGGGSDSDGTIVSYSWNHISGPATNAMLSSTTAEDPTYECPASLSGATDVWRLTVTDNGGATDTDDVSITAFAATERAISGGVEVPAFFRAN